MNKAELAAKIAESVGLTQSQGVAVIESLTKIVTDALVRGEEVTIVGFGMFLVKERKGRVGVNPRNPSEKMTFAPVNAPKFRAGKNLKDALKAKG